MTADNQQSQAYTPQTEAERELVAAFLKLAPERRREVAAECLVVVCAAVSATEIDVDRETAVG